MSPLLRRLACLALAAVWAGSAAAQLPAPNDPAFEYETAMNYLTGQGVARDPVEAVAWLRKAAQQGHAEAQVQLGVCFQSGTGVPADAEQAFEWFRKAAEQGNPRGQLQLGLAYQRGRGVPVDIAKGLELVRKAAEAGHPKAQLDLGLAYRDGFGTNPDPEQAAFWVALSASQGSPVARAVLPQVRSKLAPEQRAAVAQRVEAWRKQHPAQPVAEGP